VITSRTRMRVGSATVVSRAAIAGIAVVATLLSGCREVSRDVYRPPTVALRNVRVDGVGLTGGSLRVALLVRNPNFYPLSTARMRYQLLVGDSVVIASGVDSTQRRVASHDSTVVELPVQVSWQGLSTAGRTIAASGLVPYQLVGVITLDTPVGTHDIPVNQRGRFAPLRR
jgi:LEA14-like dessication related protein